MNAFEGASNKTGYFCLKSMPCFGDIWTYKIADCCSNSTKERS